MSEKEALKIFMGYLTGIISTEDFWKRYTADESLRNALINDKKGINDTSISQRTDTYVT